MRKCVWKSRTAGRKWGQGGKQIDVLSWLTLRRVSKQTYSAHWAIFLKLLVLFTLWSQCINRLSKPLQVFGCEEVKSQGMFVELPAAINSTFADFEWEAKWLESSKCVTTGLQSPLSGFRCGLIKSNISVYFKKSYERHRRQKQFTKLACCIEWNTLMSNAMSSVLRWWHMMSKSCSTSLFYSKWREICWWTLICARKLQKGSTWANCPLWSLAYEQVFMSPQDETHCDLWLVPRGWFLVRLLHAALVVDRVTNVHFSDPKVLIYIQDVVWLYTGRNIQRTARDMAVQQ